MRTYLKLVFLLCSFLIAPFSYAENKTDTVDLEKIFRVVEGIRETERKYKFFMTMTPTYNPRYYIEEIEQDKEKCNPYALTPYAPYEFGNWSKPLTHFASPTLKAMQKILEAGKHIPAASKVAHSVVMLRMMNTLYQTYQRNQSFYNTTHMCDLLSDVSLLGANYFLYRDYGNSQTDRALSTLLKTSSTANSEVKKQQKNEAPESWLSWNTVEYIRRLGMSFAELSYPVFSYLKHSPGLNGVTAYKGVNYVYEIAEDWYYSRDDFKREIKNSILIVILYGQILSRQHNAQHMVYYLLAAEYMTEAAFTYLESSL